MKDLSINNSIMLIQEAIFASDFFLVYKLIQENKSHINIFGILPFINEYIDLYEDFPENLGDFNNKVNIQECLKLYKLIIKDIIGSSFYHLKFKDQIRIIDIYNKINQDAPRLFLNEIETITKEIEDSLRSEKFLNAYINNETLRKYILKIGILLAIDKQTYFKLLMDEPHIKTKIIEFVKCSAEYDNSLTNTFWKNYSIINNLTLYLLNTKEEEEFLPLIKQQSIKYLNCNIISKIFSEFNNSGSTYFTTSIEIINQKGLLVDLVNSVSFLLYNNKTAEKYLDLLKKIILHPLIDVNAKDEDGATALMKASYHCDSHHILLLINNGADIHAIDNYGDTALMNIVQSFAGYDGKVVKTRRRDFTQLFISKGLDINAKDALGKTALMYAAENGYKEIVELLINNGANVNARNNRNFSPLICVLSKSYFSYVNDHCEIIKILLKTANIDFFYNENRIFTVFEPYAQHEEIAESLTKDICENLDQYSDEFFKDKNYRKMIADNMFNIDSHLQLRLACLIKVIEFCPGDNSEISKFESIKKEILKFLNYQSKAENIDKSITFFSPDSPLKTSTGTRNIE